MDPYQERKQKVERHPELPWVWRAVTVVLVAGLLREVALVVRDVLKTVDDQLLPFSPQSLIGTILFAILLYGDLRLRKWSIVPAAFALAEFVIYDLVSFWIVLFMGAGYVYLRVKIKWFPPEVESRPEQ